MTASVLHLSYHRHLRRTAGKNPAPSGWHDHSYQNHKGGNKTHELQLKTWSRAARASKRYDDYQRI